MTLPFKAPEAWRSGEIFLALRNTGLLTPQSWRCNTVIVIYQKDLSTLPHILFLRIQSLRRYTPLEMTREGDSHRDDYVSLSDDNPPLPVISSGVNMLYDSTVKNRYSCDESRNLPCIREYKAFNTPILAL